MPENGGVRERQPSWRRGHHAPAAPVLRIVGTAKPGAARVPAPAMIRPARCLGFFVRQANGSDRLIQKSHLAGGNVVHRSDNCEPALFDLASDRLAALVNLLD